MRTSILLWSTFSGLILGLFIDATLIGVALLLSTVIPGMPIRPSARWATTLTLIVLVGIPLVMGVLGYLEGQLKTV